MAPLFRRFLISAFLLLAAVAPARAETCAADKAGAAVDAAGLKLRQYNSEAQPKLRDRLQVLSKKKGWTGDGSDVQALDYLQDARSAEFDTQANELLSKIDTLGRPDKSGQFTCANLAEIEAASAELLAVMKAKSAHLDGKLDSELGVAKVAAASQTAVKTVETAPAPKVQAPPVAARKAPEEKKKPEVQDAYQPPQGKEEESAGWSTTTNAAPPQGAGVPDVAPLPPIEFETANEGYTIDEIREASRGFFGTISTGLGSVIEKAFSGAGRPSAYILGTEGGGAFLAGLRYGNGTLYMRQGGTRKVYWHGPSIGSDFGAEGGRTLILVYKLRDPDDLYRRYTGVDGSAYFVGGVGMTVLKGGPVIMAPIRSGLGFRVGANIGYLRFTDRPTWNPF